MTLKDKLNQLLASDKLDKALELLMEKLNGVDPDLYNTLILLKARYTSNENDNNSGIVSQVDYKIEKVKIMYDFQQTMEKVHDSLLNKFIEDSSGKSKNEERSFRDKFNELKNNFNRKVINGNEIDELEKFYVNYKEDIDDIILAIESQKCVLFIGPEISVDENGNSLHNSFNSNYEYHKEDQLFMPNTENRIFLHAKEYYNKEFPAKNKRGNDILEHLAQIPFSLILSYCPDDSLYRIFSANKIKTNFFYYNKEILNIEDRLNLENPIIYNPLGCCTSNNGFYIFTRKDFKDFIDSEPDRKIPRTISSIMQKAGNYVFIGFNFDKWYYRLMMYELGFQDNHSLYASENSGIDQSNRIYLEKQFKLTFINADYLKFSKFLLLNISKRIDKQCEST